MEERWDRIPQRPQNAPAPASFAQQRFWFMHQLEPGNTAYNELKTSRISVPLDADLLKRALLALMQRHEILRTNFAFSNGQVYQQIHPYEEVAADLSLLEIDLRETPVAEREQKAQKSIEAARKRPFDLAQELLWRNVLIRMGETETIVASVIHHTLCDGQGLDIFEKELYALYQALQAHQPMPLPAMELQYADFAYWEQQRSQGDLWEQQLTYWKQTLADLSNRPLLQGDQPRQFVQGAHKASVPFIVPASVTEKLRELSSREGVTLFMSLLATLQLLLFHYSGEDDIVVGTPISSRTKTELETLIGCFINMLVLRTDFSGEPTFQDLLQRVRDVSLEAYANRDIPFEKLVAELAPERQKSRNPFFQILLDFQNSAPSSSGSAEANPATRRIAVDASQFDLIIGLWDNGIELTGEIFYISEFFDTATVESIRDHFLLLLAGVTADPTQSIVALPALTETERQTIADWNTLRVQNRTEPDTQFVSEQEYPAEADETEPRTPLEEILAEIWVQILGVEWVGIYDNFFKIGGHSLLATQLLVQTQEILGIEIPLQLVFDAPTIAGFAEAI
ncbi:MAG TPA: condensation domain-containing protein, partial [Ktedonobacteraceae bacterium]|nr:condensation domain-containing protein [Ktedonobacteraceae bacterium]